MNTYQLTLILKNTVDEKARQTLLDSITKNFGKLEKEDLWGKKKLAYPIAKQEDAYYAHYTFASAPDTIKELNRQIKLNENIIRHLLVRVDN